MTARPTPNYPAAYGALSEALVVRFPLIARELAELFEDRVHSPSPHTNPAIVEAWRSVAWDLRGGLASFDQPTR